MVWPVGALCQAIADALQTRFSGVVVEGELAGFSRAASGHCYFSLKDAQGQLRCAMFRRAASLMDFHPREGDRVQVRGRLDLYAPRGELQLIVESMQQAGLGALFEQFLRLKARLQSEGLFEESRKRPLPAFPRAIGLVTSLGAAALRDVVITLRRRAPHVPVVVANAQVQGGPAAAEIRLALQQLQQFSALAERDGTQAPLDVIMLVRGGGSMEDLWAFNDEALARAIANSAVPVMTGIGHETDFTIADFVADVRAPTPTAAAELVSESQQAHLRLLVHESERLNAAALRRLDRQAQWLDGLGSRLGRPSDRLAQASQKLSRLEHGLQMAVQSRWMAAQSRLAQHGPQLQAQWARQILGHQQGLARLSHALKLLDPQHVLSRGFAWLEDEHAQALTSVSQVRTGQAIMAHLSDGQLRAEIKALEIAEPSGP
jgi:exodeoxyribonuclease VII large subunit